jgi:26S proteasome regulatory subunit N6
MSTTKELLAQAETESKSNPQHAEQLYKKILTSAAASTSSDPDSLRDQESALIKLGELYRDQKNAAGVAEVITLSRSFMSSTAKAKTAKLSMVFVCFPSLCF